MTPTTPATTTSSHAWLTSRLGRILLTGDEQGLTGLQIDTPERPATPDPDTAEDAAPFRDAIEQLTAYFAGDLQDFDLKLNPKGTDFQQRAWQTLQRIPFGQTITYGEQAKRMGDTNASRAVGARLGARRRSDVGRRRLRWRRRASASNLTSRRWGR